MHTTKRSNQFHIRPWVRFWARMIDYNCLGIVYGFIFSRYYIYVPLIFFPFFSIIVIPLLWVPIESILLWTIGTTPGKWLLKITVRNSRHRKKYLLFQQAFRRSISVWFFGMGAGIPIIQIIALIIAKIKLHRTGTTIWDRNSHLMVRCGRIGILRTFIIILLFFITFFILVSPKTRSLVIWKGHSEWN